MKKRLLKIGLYLGLLFMLGVASAILLAAMYEEEVQGYAIGQITTSLKTDVNVGEVELTLFRRFPKISLAFEDVMIEDTYGEGDTLLFADHLYLEFNLLAFLKGNYQVSQVSVDAGKVKLKIDEEGRDNYHFWKPSEQHNSAFSFALEGVSLEDIALTFDDRSSDFYLDVLVGDAGLSGDFQSARFGLETQGTFDLHVLSIAGDNYAVDKNLSLDIGVDMNFDTQNFAIAHAAMQLGKIPFNLEGEIYEVAEQWSCRLNIDGSALSLKQLSEELPQFVQSALTGYVLTGRADLNATINGPMGNGYFPEVTILFDLHDGHFKHKHSGVAMAGIQTVGNFVWNSENKGEIVLKEFAAKFADGSFSMAGSMVNFETPMLHCALKGDLDLNDVFNFLDLADLEILEGRVDLAVSLSGKLQRLGQISEQDLRNIRSSGKFSFRDTRVKFKSFGADIQDINGTLLFNDKDLLIDNGKGRCGHSDFNLSGALRNMLPWALSEGEVLSGGIQLSMDQFNASDWMPGEESNRDSLYVVLPKDFDFSVDLSVNDFTYKHFKAKKMLAKVYLSPSRIDLKDISLNTCSGQIEGQLSLDNKQLGSIYGHSQINLSGIDIRALFLAFDNFGQTLISHENLRGTTSAKISSTLRLSPSLELDDRSLRGRVDISIVNGELIDLKSMESIADYLRENRLISSFVDAEKLDESLKHIRFSKLENVIEIRDETIYIPQMEIKSSALDMGIAGWHRFDNHIDYSMRFQLRDILIRKGGEFANVQDDGLGKLFFLSMTGTTENPAFAFDRDAAKSNRQQQIKEEKEKLKDLFKEEFGGAKSKQEKKEAYREEPKINVSWEERPQEEEKETPKQKGWLQDDDEDF